jgi:hypothetical protein
VRGEWILGLGQWKLGEKPNECVALIDCSGYTHFVLRRAEAETMAKNRLQFDFTDEALQELDELKSATGAASRAEVIRRALQMLQWTIEQVRDEHGTVIVEKNGRQREVIFPFLTSAKGTANGR